MTIAVALHAEKGSKQITWLPVPRGREPWTRIELLRKGGAIKNRSSGGTPEEAHEEMRFLAEVGWFVSRGETIISM